MAVVRFAAYRQYESDRVEASNALMALLAGAQLASHLLKLNEGSDRLLPEVYPNVAHIRRFNLTAEAAGEILSSADTHLGAMSVPYALGIHEDYMRICLGLLVDARLANRSTLRAASADQHRLFESGTGGAFDTDSLIQLQTLRMMRNCRIHNGSRASSVLVDEIAGWTTSVEASWIALAGRSPSYLSEGDPVTFGHGEMLLALAITKRLDREANEMLQRVLPREMWADMLAADLEEILPRARTRSNALRKARGLGRHHFSALNLTDEELTAAISRLP